VTNNPTPMRPANNLPIELFALSGALLALLGYYLPFNMHRAAALTANAYDLAEWVGLAPSQRAQTPQMPATLLLRLLLLGLAIIFALRARGLKVWWAWFLPCIPALTLLPPVEFVITSFGREDPNYIQLAVLAGITWAGVIGLFLTQKRKVPARLLEGIMALVCLAALIGGVVLAFGVIRALQVTPQVGIGVIITGIGLMIVLMSAFLTRSKYNRK
jgi:hypothetical protein